MTGNAAEWLGNVAQWRSQAKHGQGKGVNCFAKALKAEQRKRNSYTMQGKGKAEE